VKRRAFLGFGLGLIAAGVVRRAFADVSTSGVQRGELDGAVERAREGKRPILILVIPTDETKKYDRGRAFGEWLNHGSDEQLRSLGAVEVAAATMADVRRRWPSAGAGDPLMVLVRNDVVQLVDGDLPVSVDGGRRGGDDATEVPIIKRRIAKLASLADRAIGQHGDAAEVRARLVKRPVPGSRWAVATGCGTTVEGDDNPMRVKCGMGHVPALSQRFLYFFTKERP